MVFIPWHKVAANVAPFPGGSMLMTFDGDSGSGKVETVTELVLYEEL